MITELTTQFQQLLSGRGSADEVLSGVAAGDAIEEEENDGKQEVEDGKSFVKDKIQKKWKFKLTEDFYKDVSMKESTGNPRNVNSYGFIGLYQLGEAALVDIGYYYKESKNYSKNDWKGKWTGKNGIDSLESFLNNPEVQTKAVKEYHQLVWNRYLKDYHQYEGKEINGVNLTKSGMVAAAHLVGHGGLKRFINSNGLYDKQDTYNTKCSDYLIVFQDHKLNW